MLKVTQKIYISKALVANPARIRSQRTGRNVWFPTSQTIIFLKLAQAKIVTKQVRSLDELTPAFIGIKVWLTQRAEALL